MTQSSVSQRNVVVSSYAQLASRRRYALIAGLTFLDAVASSSVGPETLSWWLQHHVVGSGWMAWPGKVSQSVVGTLPLVDGADVSPTARGLADAIAQEARAEVIHTLRAFIQPPFDDRFLAGAIFSGRVQRDSRGMMASWVPRPHMGDALSNIVLSLFAADILGYREAYEGGLFICKLCSRAYFDATGGNERPICRCR